MSDRAAIFISLGLAAIASAILLTNFYRVAANEDGVYRLNSATGDICAFAGAIFTLVQK